MALPIKWVDKIFKKLTARFGHAFISQFTDVSAAKESWAEALAGASSGEITKALEADYDGLPTWESFLAAAVAPKSRMAAVAAAEPRPAGLKIDWAYDIAANHFAYPRVSRLYAYEVLSRYSPCDVPQALLVEFSAKD